jgi:class 3 adenylate cyclase
MSDWTKFKKKLAQKVPWLTPIDGPFSLLLNEAIDANPIEPLWYDPLLIEGLFKDVGEILNRCLIYRRDAQELETIAVKVAADYAKFTELVPNQREAEVNAQALDRLTVEFDAAVGSAAAFQSDVTNKIPIASGLSAIEIGKQKAIQSAIILANRQITLVEERWQMAVKYEDQAQARHIEPGSSHNYSDRMKRILRFLAEDLQEAFAKSRAMLAGVRHIYGKDYSIPDIKADTSLDELVHVVRAASRYLESESLKDSAYEVVVPLAQAWLNGGGNSRCLISPVELTRAIAGNEDISVDLSPVFSGQTHMRLKGIGVSFGEVLSKNMDPGWLAEKSAYRLSAMITPPGVLVGGQPVPRPAVRFGNISVFSGSSNLAWYDGTSCINANPVGLWKLRFYPLAVHCLTDERAIVDVVKDVKLHLSVVSRLTT